MVVSITWALSSNGDAISDKDWGALAAGSASSPVQLYLRHDGENPITNCGFYLRPVQEGYTGSNSPLEDYQELLSWGDDDKGVLLSFDSITYYPHDNTSGKDPSNAIELPSGSIGAGAESMVYLKLSIPVSIGSPPVPVAAGTRQFDHVFRYSYTS